MVLRNGIPITKPMTKTKKRDKPCHVSYSSSTQGRNSPAEIFFHNSNACDQSHCSSLSESTDLEHEEQQLLASSDYLAFQKRIEFLQKQNETLASDKALLEIDLLETQQEGNQIIQQLKHQLHAVHDEKAKNDLDLFNVVITLERQMKKDQIQFLELFANKDKEIMTLKKKLRSTEKALSKEHRRRKSLEAESVSASTNTTDSLSDNSSVVTKKDFDKSTYTMVTLQNELNALCEQKITTEKKLKNSAKIDESLAKKQSLIDHLKEMIAEQDITIGRLMFVNSSQKLDEYKEQLLSRIKDSNEQTDVDGLLKERRENNQLIGKMKNTIESLCKALEDSDVSKKELSTKLEAMQKKKA